MLYVDDGWSSLSPIFGVKKRHCQSMSSLLRIAHDRGRRAAIASGASVGVPKRRLGVTGIS